MATPSGRIFSRQDKRQNYQKPFGSFTASPNHQDDLEEHPLLYSVISSENSLESASANVDSGACAFVADQETINIGLWTLGLHESQDKPARQGEHRL